MGLRIEAKILKEALIIARLKGIKSKSIDLLAQAVADIFDESIEILQKYPAETDGNSPPPPYYKRGTGMMQAVKGGGEAVREKRRSANTLATHWKYDISNSADGVTGTISNDAENPGWLPYAGFVHGSDNNDPPQTLFHRANGWPIAKDVIAERAKADAPILTRVMRGIKNFFDRG